MLGKWFLRVATLGVLTLSVGCCRWCERWCGHPAQACYPAQCQPCCCVPCCPPAGAAAGYAPAQPPTTWNQPRVSPPACTCAPAQ